MGIRGKFPETVKLPREYFEKRGCFLDCRGPLIIAASSYWGFGVRVLTESHSTHDWPRLGPIIPRRVQVDDGAWIGSFSILIGCHIGAHAVVATGSVVRGQNVGPDVMVAGNPARVIAQWADGKWVYLPDEVSGFVRELV